MKEKNESKKQPDIDYEKLYYQAMQENILMKNKKISFEFTEAEINYLRGIMYEELMDMKYDLFSSDDEDEQEEGRKLGKLKKDDYLNTVIDERRVMIEQIIKKLRFEI